MKQVQILLVWLIAFTFTASAIQNARAEEYQPESFAPPLPPPDLIVSPSPDPDSLSSQSKNGSGTAVKVPPLKAVLVVGPIDGDDGQQTVQAKTDMELAAVELEKNGVEVHRFYTPHNDWGAIVAAARGAHFFAYRGHGIAWTSGPTPVVGGMALKDVFISSDQIRSDLRLARNAIVMIYACFSAGSSSTDTTPIDLAEAKRRVMQYSDPFIDTGARGYYANWFGDAFQIYVRNLFAGKTLGQSYEDYFDFNPATVERMQHPEYSSLSMWLDKDEWYDPKPQYNNAFVGRPNETLVSLFSDTKVAKPDLQPVIYLPVLVH
jgi:hypothetical protein